jgi:hypothetical protein
MANNEIPPLQEALGRPIPNGVEVSRVYIDYHVEQPLMHPLLTAQEMNETVEPLPDRPSLHDQALLAVVDAAERRYYICQPEARWPARQPVIGSLFRLMGIGVVHASVWAEGAVGTERSSIRLEGTVAPKTFQEFPVSTTTAAAWVRLPGAPESLQEVRPITFVVSVSRLGRVTCGGSARWQRAAGSAARLYFRTPPRRKSG